VPPVAFVGLGRLHFDLPNPILRFGPLKFGHFRSALLRRGADKKYHQMMVQIIGKKGLTRRQVLTKRVFHVGTKTKKELVEIREKLRYRDDDSA
jgi:hypothetical protein